MARSRGRAYLALARVSNLPTVWTNVLAGMVVSYPAGMGDFVQSAAGHDAGSGGLGAVSFGISEAIVELVVFSVACSLLYVGGMVLNDAFDAEFDARHRPDRPIPAGEVGRVETFVVGGALMVAGVALLAFSLTSLATAGALGMAIVYYDYAHKTDPLGPLVMGVCRGLVYLIPASVIGAFAPAVLAAAAIVTVYVAALTLVAKYGGARYGWSIKYLIAGISLVDAAIIACVGPWPVAIVAALGFPLTLLAQKWVEGT